MAFIFIFMHEIIYKLVNRQCQSSLMLCDFQQYFSIPAIVHPLCMQHSVLLKYYPIVEVLFIQLYHYSLRCMCQLQLNDLLLHVIANLYLHKWRDLSSVAYESCIYRSVKRKIYFLVNFSVYTQCRVATASGVAVASGHTQCTIPSNK